MAALAAAHSSNTAAAQRAHGTPRAATGDATRQNATHGTARDAAASSAAGDEFLAMHVQLSGSRSRQSGSTADTPHRNARDAANAPAVGGNERRENGEDGGEEGVDAEERGAELQSRDAVQLRPLAAADGDGSNLELGVTPRRVRPRVTYDETTRRGRKRPIRVRYIGEPPPRGGNKQDAIEISTATVARIVDGRYEWRDSALPVKSQRR